MRKKRLMREWAVERAADGTPLRLYWLGDRAVPPRECWQGGTAHPEGATFTVGRYRRCRLCRKAWEVREG